MVMPSRAYSREVNALHLRLQVQWFGRASAMGRTRPHLRTTECLAVKRRILFCSGHPQLRNFIKHRHKSLIPRYASRTRKTSPVASPTAVGATDSLHSWHQLPITGWGTPVQREAKAGTPSSLSMKRNAHGPGV